MKRTIIILNGPPMAGKTVLARLLTHDGQSGIYFDTDQNGNKETHLALPQMLRCPRVVICAHNSNATRANPLLKELFEGAQCLVINIAPGDGSAIIPTKAFSEPSYFRKWLFCQGDYTFTGGVKELNEIFQQLPLYPSLRDLKKIQHPSLHF